MIWYMHVKLRMFQLTRRLDNFRRDPFGSLLRKLRNLVTWASKKIKLLYDRWAEYQLRRRRCLDFLNQRPSNAIPPDFADLWFLYKTVRSRKPHCVLEFGSGCSTVIMLQALWENLKDPSTNSTILYSVDADPYWAKVTANSLPTHLQKLCDIRYSPLLEIEYKGVPAFQHTVIPNITPGLIYLDGPALTPHRQVAVDVLNMEERFQPGFCLIIDGRWQNTMFLKIHMKRRYKFKNRRLFFNSIFELIGD